MEAERGNSVVHSNLVLELTDPVGTRIATRNYTLNAQREALDTTAATTGWHTFRIRLVDPVAANLQSSYKLTVTYEAP